MQCKASQLSKKSGLSLRKASNVKLTKITYSDPIEIDGVSFQWKIPSNTKDRKLILCFEGRVIFTIAFGGIESYTMQENLFFSDYDALVKPISSVFSLIGIDVPDHVITSIFMKSQEYLKNIDSNSINNSILAKSDASYVIKAERYDLISRMARCRVFSFSELSLLDIKKLSEDDLKFILGSVGQGSPESLVFDSSLIEKHMRENKFNNDVQNAILLNYKIDVLSFSDLFDDKDEWTKRLLNERLRYAKKYKSEKAKTTP